MAKLIDPIYKKYASKVIGTLANTEFYNYFMDVMRAGQNSVQFSNRRIEKTVDERWVTAIEAVIRPMQEIINNPRNFIMQEEVIVNVALSKTVTPDTIRHLAQHGSMIDEVSDDNVRPNRLMEKFKEDSWNTYENRFVYTLLEMSYDFVDKRYKAIFEALNEEYGAYLKMTSEAKSYQEHIQTNIDIRIQQEEDLLSVDEKNQNIFARIARLHRLLTSFKASGFAKEMEKYARVRPPLVRTNAIAKNPNLKACHKLWDFLIAYQDVGYSIEIYEQSTEITDDFLQDIMHSIMFDYIILKNYLEQTRDRAIDTSRPFRKKKMKPQYIKEIIEELVKNYDLPDVEIRKVLIEEITKAQLLKEEEAERRRLVEEKEKEMRERARQEKLEREKQARAAERERLRQEKEREKEAARLEKERLAELARQEKERQRIEQEEQLRLERFRAELDLMLRDRKNILQARAHAEEAARRRLEAEAEKLRRAEEKRLQDEARKAEQERLRQEKLAELEAQRKAREEEKLRIKEEQIRQKEEEKARIAAERERLRQEKEAARKQEQERLTEEKARLAAEKAKEKERLAQELAAQKEKERLAREKTKEKERLAKEAAALKEKERLAREKTKEKERLAKEAAALKEKERLAREKAKEKERLAREKAKEKERLAREKEKEKEQAGKKQRRSEQLSRPEEKNEDKVPQKPIAEESEVKTETSAAEPESVITEKPVAEAATMETVNEQAGQDDLADEIARAVSRRIREIDEAEETVRESPVGETKRTEPAPVPADRKKQGWRGTLKGILGRNSK